MKRELLATGLGVSIALGLTACASGPNDNNEYTVSGTVIEVNNDHIVIDDVTMLESRGKQPNIHDDGTLAIDDNYWTVNCIKHETSDELDALLDAGSLAVGNTVTIEASVGQSKVNCVAYSANTGYLTDHRSMLLNIEVTD